MTEQSHCPSCGSSRRRHDSRDDVVWCARCGREYEPYALAAAEVDPRMQFDLAVLGALHSGMADTRTLAGRLRLHVKPSIIEARHPAGSPWKLEDIIEIRLMELREGGEVRRVGQTLWALNEKGTRAHRTTAPRLR